MDKPLQQRLTLHLETLACRDPDRRRAALEQVLAAEGLAFTLQEEEPSVKLPRGIRNYLVEPGEAASSRPALLLCAHYDAAFGSLGVNDNAASLCILVTLAKALAGEGAAVKFAFFDGEESGFSGSRLYVSRMDKQTLAGVINLDMCGYGDSLVICGRGHEKSALFRPFCRKAFLEPFSGQVVRFLPKGDESSFARTRIPVLSMAMVPRWDISYLKALATYGEGFLGRPPEFDMMLGQMEVVTTMHGGFRDGLEWIQPEAMETVYRYLEAVVHGLEKGQAGKRISCFPGLLHTL